MRDTAHGLELIGQGVDAIGGTLQRDGQSVTMRVNGRGESSQNELAPFL